MARERKGENFQQITFVGANNCADKGRKSDGRHRTWERVCPSRMLIELLIARTEQSVRPAAIGAPGIGLIFSPTLSLLAPSSAHHRGATIELSSRLRSRQS